MSASMAEAIRLELRKGSYQMPGDTLPYETQATKIAEALAANGYGNVREALEELIAATETGLSLAERDIIVRFLRAATERASGG